MEEETECIVRAEACLNGDYFARFLACVNQDPKLLYLKTIRRSVFTMAHHRDLKRTLISEFRSVDKKERHLQLNFTSVDFAPINCHSRVSNDAFLFKLVFYGILN